MVSLSMEGARCEAGGWVRICIVGHSLNCIYTPCSARHEGRIPSQGSLMVIEQHEIKPSGGFRCILMHCMGEVPLNRWLHITVSPPP